MQFKKGDIVLVNYKGSRHLTRILDVINASDGNVYYQVSGYAYAKDTCIEAAEITKEFLLFNQFVDKSTDSVEMYERDTVSVYRVLEKKTDFWTIEVCKEDFFQVLDNIVEYYDIYHKSTDYYFIKRF